ncbi:glycosyltransferase family A protein [uncultured Pseudacidovorax sp.]|uniref:glycosyltransferase family 2 protein n=1 Tax=uncultured Pseudacidovorax sp. TaxID=679313 RepID=UPI0025F31E17|nr:glycosyltransferase family A protein [uncultured Pseudacidovorax sp.]
MTATLLHVLIPTYNCGKYIAEAVDSVLAQGVEGLRITVVDNASTDNTSDILASYVNNGKIEYRKNIRNVGGIANHNVCLDAAKGKYIKLLSADDILLPGILQAQIAALETDATIGIVTCDCAVIDSTGNSLGEARYLSGRHIGSDVVIACANKVSNFIGGPSNTMLRGSAIDPFRWDGRFAWTADLMFFCEMLQNSNFLGLGTIGVAYRRRSGSISDASCPLPVRRRSDFEFIRRYSRNPLAYARWVVRYAKAGLM